MLARKALVSISGQVYRTPCPMETDPVSPPAPYSREKWKRLEVMLDHLNHEGADCTQLVGFAEGVMHILEDYTEAE